LSADDLPRGSLIQIQAQTTVQLRVVGCHGGETPKHRTSAFILDDRLAIDAGSLTSGLDLKL
jgi:hypothetical protein